MSRKIETHRKKLYELALYARNLETEIAETQAMLEELAALATRKRQALDKALTAEISAIIAAGKEEGLC